MKKIPSFTVDHIHLLRGIYVSRKDAVGDEIITTFDIRMKEPNREPCLSPSAIHTIEHLAATFLRADGLPHRKLSCSKRRPAIGRHRGPDERNLPFHLWV